MGMEDFFKGKNDRLNDQLLFTARIDEMTSVLRRTLLIDRSRRENDAEHSWHIAVMAMLYKEYATEPVDIGRVVQMCVVHDLVEIEAGDTFAYDTEGNKNKEQRQQFMPGIGPFLLDLQEEIDLPGSFQNEEIFHERITSGNGRGRICGCRNRFRW